MRIVITKCYLVQVVDSEGNELEREYVFGDRQAAQEAGRRMKDYLMEETTEKKCL